MLILIMYDNYDLIKIKTKSYIIGILRPVVALAQCDCRTDWLWVRSPLEEMKYLL